MFNRLFWIVVFFLYSIVVSAQLPTGSWRDHLPYSHGKKLAEYDSRIFCLSSDGSLYSFNTRDRTTDKYSKVTGLHDADISTIGTSETSNSFFIGYSNGNIDVVRNDSIINIPDIKRKMITGEKKINNVYFLENFAYLACGFGIVLCDLAKLEIKDTYFFGPGGSQINVNAITSDSTSLYAATEQGIYTADLQGSNLLDFNSWTKITALPDPEAEYRHIVKYNNMLFTLYSHNGTDEVISFGLDSWNVWPNGNAPNYEHIGEQHGNLVLSTPDRIMVFGSNQDLIINFGSYYARHVLIDSQQKLWYAAAFGGLIMIDEAGNNSRIAVEGPEYRDVGEIEIYRGNVWVGGGTINSQWSSYGAYSMIDEKWKSYNSNTIPELKGFLNISEISIDPSDPGHVIGGSYGYGIAEFRDGQLVDLQDYHDGILKQADGYEGDSGYIRVTGTDIDAGGNIFAFTSISRSPFYVKPIGEEWKSVDLDYDNFGQGTNTSEILASSNHQVWLLIANKPFIIVTEFEDGEKIRERSFQVKNSQGTAFDNVLSVAEDKDGSIWIGTNKGPVIYMNPEEIFDVSVVEGYQPLIPRRDGTNFASLLLASEQINDIEVDGANRKWLATQKSGVFLVSPDGKKELLHFTEDNSPLLSNSVQTIAVNDVTGEVFFGTDKGMMGFRAGATEADDEFGDVYVFPNPVREDFSGDITVTGLARDVNVKITDIAGNLVYETTALGGQAIWNGKNFRGNRVQTGVYLVFCTNEDGTKTFVTKLLFIH